jgi:hypothetical protein
VGDTLSPSPGPLVLGAGAGLALLATALVSTLLAVLAGTGGCAPHATQAAPGAAADSIPARYLRLYELAGRAFDVPWTVLAAIGRVESDHGRSSAPGVHAGVNAYGCCAGPMQFNVMDGPPSSWERYGTDANRDGHTSPYDPADAIPAAGRYLRALLDANDDDLIQALLGYNRSAAYVTDVLARARTYSTLETAAGPETASGEGLTPETCAAGADAVAGSADLRRAVVLTFPRAYRPLPHWAAAGTADPGLIDSRLYPDLIWILLRYHLRVSAARQAGHHTHGDGTAADLVPADGTTQPSWHASAGALARDLGWTPACAASGSRPACPLAPAIQFIGYDGYPGHGSPRTCTGACAAHLHISWASPCYGTSELAAPCRQVMAFPAPP